MMQQSEYVKAYEKRLALLESDPEYTVLASINQPMASDATKMTQYIVYTNFKNDRHHEKISSIFVYSPFENVDKYGHSKADFQCQLLFETNKWQDEMHLTVLETLGSESRLAFYDFQGTGLAQLALRALLNLAQKNEIKQIDGNISSFDEDSFKKVVHILQKNQFDVRVQASNVGHFVRQFAIAQ